MASIKALGIASVLSVVFMASGAEAQAGGIQPLPPIYAKFLRGDCNTNGEVEITDVITVLQLISAIPGQEIVCPDACDYNRDGRITLIDPVRHLEYMFAGGLPPAYPFPEAAEERLLISLTCFDPDYLDARR